MDGWIELFLECPHCEGEDYYEVKVNVSRGIIGGLDVRIYNGACECSECKKLFEAMLDEYLEVGIEYNKGIKPRG